MRNRFPIGHKINLKRIPSKDTREKMSRSHIGKNTWSKGKTPWNKNKIGVQKGITGPANHNWKGGITPEKSKNKSIYKYETLETSSFRAR